MSVLSEMSPASPATANGRGRRGWAPHRQRKQWSWWLWLLPALSVYTYFVLVPLTQTVRFSLYAWDGIGVAKWVGLSNYGRVFKEPELFGSILNAFILIIFFTVLPVSAGLGAAALLREIRSRSFATVARVVLFLPQIIPLAGAAIAWTWMYSDSGVINQVLRAIGLDSITRPWLGDFGTALPAVGLIGTWVAFGLCTVLFNSAIGKIEPSLYEAARLDGAGRIREFRAITVPGLRQEILVCVTVLIISSLASFDIVYVATLGGPGYTTMVPGVEIYQLTFTEQKVGLASALALVLAVLVLLVVGPLQRLGRER